MKKLRILLILIFISSFAYTQQIGADIIKFKGNITTAVRNTFDVPVGETWLIWNTTSTQYESGDENETWSAFGAGDMFIDGNNVVTSAHFTGTSAQNGVYVTLDGYLGTYTPF